MPKQRQKTKKFRSQPNLGLSVLAELKLRLALLKKCPSEPWVDAQFKTIGDSDGRGESIVRRVHDPRVFPPGGAATAMVPCSICGIYNPPNAMEGGHCLDHSSHDGWGPSPSALAIAMLQFRNLRPARAKLHSESAPALKKEILRYLKRKQKSETRAQKRTGG